MTVAFLQNEDAADSARLAILIYLDNGQGGASDLIAELWLDNEMSPS